MLPSPCSFPGYVTHGILAALVAPLAAYLVILLLRKQVARVWAFIGEAALGGFLEGIFVTLIVCQLGHRSSINDARVLPVTFSMKRVLFASVVGTAAGLSALYLGLSLDWCPMAGSVVTGITVALMHPKVG